MNTCLTLFLHLVLSPVLHEACSKLMVYRKRKDYIRVIGGEDFKLLSRRPYTELRSLNGASNPRQR